MNREYIWLVNFPTFVHLEEAIERLKERGVKEGTTFFDSQNGRLSLYNILIDTEDEEFGVYYHAQRDSHFFTRKVIQIDVSKGEIVSDVRS